MKQTVHRFDSKVTRYISSIFGIRSRSFFALVTHLGDPTAVVLVTAALIGFGVVTDNIPLAVSGAIIPATTLIGYLLKLLFERARPMTEYALNMKLQTFSFPSGHSSGSMITYGLVGYLCISSALSPWLTVLGMLSLLIPLLVGVSRVYLGAHFPSDVLAGWLLGAVALGVVIGFIGPVV